MFDSCSVHGAARGPPAGQLPPAGRVLGGLMYGFRSPRRGVSGDPGQESTPGVEVHFGPGCRHLTETSFTADFDISLFPVRKGKSTCVSPLYPLGLGTRGVGLKKA